MSLIEKYTNRIMSEDPTLSREQATLIAESFYALARMAFDGFKEFQE